MDPTVPISAAHILNFVRETEVGTAARSGYDVIYGFNQNKIPKPVTSMNIVEIQSAQKGWSNLFGSSATGGYQFMRRTLGDLKSELGLGGGQILDPNLQDRLGYHLLKRRGYEQFIAGGSSITFGNSLAREWASFPVLTNIKGAHRDLKRGQSYYAGDGLNKALVSPEEIEHVLNAASGMSHQPTGAEPVVRNNSSNPEGPFSNIGLNNIDPNLLREIAQKYTPEQLQMYLILSQLGLLNDDGQILNTPKTPQQEFPTSSIPKPENANTKDQIMPGKPFFQSKTFWGLALVAASQFSPAAKVVIDALGISAEGVTAAEEPAKLAMTAAGAALAWFGRLRARLPLTLK